MNRKIKESPDAIRHKSGDIKFRFKDGKAYAFGYFKNKMLVSDEGDTHGMMKHYYSSDSENYTYISGRDEMKYSGRMWISPEKMVSFWQYPRNRKIMKKVITDLESAFKKTHKKKLDIWNKFKLEVLITPDDKRYKKMSWDRIDNYIGLEYGDTFDTGKNTKNLEVKYIKFHDYDRSVDFKGSKEDVPHVKSPMIKGPSDITGNIGSKKRPTGLTATQRHQMKTSSEGKINLKSLVEYTIGKVSKQINVKIDIDKTVHAGQQQNRPEGKTSDTEIIEIVNLALPEIANMLMFDEIDMGGYVLIKHRGTMINIVGALHPGSNDEIDFVVVTVMRKENFMPKKGTKVIEV